MIIVQEVDQSRQARIGEQKKPGANKFHDSHRPSNLWSSGSGISNGMALDRCDQ